ncbi:hypothetical protein DPMN_093062 [Dreissena polymorpha]|uniref:Uncharacterized protein n=1 Tax=Dreissena polymorpha TaxID=45954 RepID=A0A9D4L3F1_DREPO|nr:hypothetical protein DPMN_093062 [Dreissena polymorpha]
MEDASKRACFAWRSYDVRFPLQQEVSFASWAVINTELWWRCTLSGNVLSLPQVVMKRQGDKGSVPRTVALQSSSVFLLQKASIAISSRA